MNFFPDDQSLLHDICVDLFNLIFLGCCSSYNSGVILWLKEKTRHLVSLCGNFSAWSIAKIERMVVMI